MQSCGNHKSQDWRKSARLAARIPLQPAAGMFTTSTSNNGAAMGGTAAVGTSSFGMSGVNAHALLSRPTSTAENAGAEPQQVTPCTEFSVSRAQFV